MAESTWVEDIRKHLAIASVGSTTLMMQAGKGRVSRAQLFLIKKMPLNNISNLSASEFNKYLNSKTIALSKLLLRPDNHQPNWGAARKVLNIYFRLCSMNKDLNTHFHLNKIEPYLEVPLDNHIVEKISSESKIKYSKTFKIKTLIKSENKKYQDLAAILASSTRLHRYELDILYWNHKKLNT